MYTVLDDDEDFKIKLLKKRLKVNEELGDEEDAVYCKANLLAFEGKYDEAMSLLENLTNPSREDIKLNIMGYIYYRKGDTQKALECAERAFELNPSFEYYHNKNLYSRALD